MERTLWTLSDGNSELIKKRVEKEQKELKKKNSTDIMVNH